MMEIILVMMMNYCNDGDYVGDDDADDCGDHCDGNDNYDDDVDDSNDFFSFFLSLFFLLQNTIRTPVYTTSQRRNAMGVGLVFEADLATTEHISHWVLQGVCLLLNTD